MSATLAATAGLSEWAEWVRTGGMIGLLMLAAKLYTDNRKLRLAEKQDDRQGFGQLIELQQRQIDQHAKRIEVQEGEIRELIEGRERDHRLILELLRQLNRTQAGAILREMAGDVSPELAPMLKRVASSESAE